MLPSLTQKNSVSPSGDWKAWGKDGVWMKRFAPFESWVPLLRSVYISGHRSRLKWFFFPDHWNHSASLVLKAIQPYVQAVFSMVHSVDCVGYWTLSTRLISNGLFSSLAYYKWFLFFLASGIKYFLLKQWTHRTAYSIQKAIEFFKKIFARLVSGLNFCYMLLSGFFKSTFSYVIWYYCQLYVYIWKTSHADELSKRECFEWTEHSVRDILTTP